MAPRETGDRAELRRCMACWREKAAVRAALQRAAFDRGGPPPLLGDYRADQSSKSAPLGAAPQVALVQDGHLTGYPEGFS